MVLDLPVLLLGVWVLLVVVLIRLGVDVYCCVCFLTVVMVTLCLRSILVFDWFSWFRCGLWLWVRCCYVCFWCLVDFNSVGTRVFFGYGLVGD